MIRIRVARVVCWLACLPAFAGAGTPADVGLVQAAKNQNTELVAVLLKQQADVNSAQPDGATALHWAAHWDDLEAAELLIRHGANVNAANDFGVTPLSLACANANSAMVQKLLAAGANPSATASTGESVLMTAVRTGSTEIVSVLLAAGAEVNARENARKQTALMWAVARRQPAIVRLLVEHGADLHARSRVVKEFVIRDRADAKLRSISVETVETAGSTPLLFAARVGAIDCAGILLDAGANVNDKSADGTSVLIMAAYSGHSEFAAFLLDRGADANSDAPGYTALHIAVLMGQLDLVKSLLAHGANPNARLTKGTPVTRFGEEPVLPQSLAGATPLLVAAKFNEVEMMRALVARGADPHLATNDGTTVLMAAVNPDKRNYNLKSGVGSEVEQRALDAVRTALEFGADIKATNKSGQTALDIAIYRKHQRIAQLLTHGRTN